jgi:hypothetical protein
MSRFTVWVFLNFYKFAQWEIGSSISASKFVIRGLGLGNASPANRLVSAISTRALAKSRRASSNDFTTWKIQNFNVDTYGQTLYTAL